MEAFRFRSSALDGCNVFMSVYEDMLAWAACVHTFSLAVVVQTDRRTPTGYKCWEERLVCALTAREGRRSRLLFCS
jgi:hypothetical protein